MEITPAALKAVAALRHAGFDAYPVGGCVRDSLVPLIGAPKNPSDPASVRAILDCAPSDWDIATNAAPEHVLSILGGRVTAKPELRHDTVMTSVDGTPVEITTFRGGAATIEEDLACRDFTVNAMALDADGRLLDPFGGANDIRAGVLRAVVDPAERFREDGLRILRGLRFAAVFGWDIEPDTALAMHMGKDLLRGIAVERTGAELVKMLCGAHVGPVLRKFWNVLSVAAPEIAPTVGFRQNNRHHHLDVWEHTIAVVEAAPAVPVLRLAALLHDLGKPACYTVDAAGIGHFYGHAARSAEIARDTMARLRFSDEIRRRVVTLVEHHGDILTDTPSRRTVRRMVSNLGVDVFHDLLALRRADIAGQRVEMRGKAMAACVRFEELLAELEAENACFSLKDLAVRGGDIMELGYRGPGIGKALRALLDAVVEERVPNERKALLELLRHDVMPGLDGPAS